jgi:hypothetical protein
MDTRRIAQVTTQHKWLPSEPTEDMHAAYYSVRQVSLNVDSYKAMWKAAPAVEQEPIMYELRFRQIPDGRFDAWAACGKKTYERYIKNPIEDDWEHEVRALYTNPQPKRERLSEENLVLMWNSSTKDIPYEHFQAVFRFAEKYHGIGIDK